MTRGLKGLRPLAPTLLLTTLLLIATGCSDVPSGNSAPPPASAPTGKADAGTPSATTPGSGATDSGSSTTASAPVGGGDSSGFCAKLAEKQAALQDIDPEADAGDAAASENALKELAGSAPAELKPAMDQVVQAYPKYVSGGDTPDDATTQQFTTALTTLYTWVGDHCPGVDLDN
jgi:hypothetical protein